MVISDSIMNKQYKPLIPFIIALIIIYYTERSECNVTEYEEPNDWDVFHAKLTASMDNFPNRTWIRYVNDQSEDHGEILYFKVESGQHHEVITYRIN
jgi:hypothetical protein